ncbi:MAG: ABC transporter permease [Acidimicrobiia bacterium]
MAERRRKDLRLVWQQIRYQNLIFWRTPVAAFFTLVFPLMFLVIFGVVFGNDLIDELGVTLGQYYAPALAVFGAASATYTNLAIQTAIARDEGILKRVRGTPLPAWIYVAGRVGSGVYIAAIAVVIMLAFGWIAYDLRIYAAAVPSLVVTFLFGVACFAALGLLVAALAPSGDATPAIANATLLPLAFISGIFFVSGPDEPAILRAIAGVFPLRPFGLAFRDGFDPLVATSAGWLDQMHWPELGVMALWMVGGALLAARFFTWEPRAGGERQPKTVVEASPAS